MLPGSHGCTWNILDGLVFIQLTQNSCPSVSSGNVASPLLLHAPLCNLWYNDTGASHFVVSQTLFLLLPSWLHSLSQTWLSSCGYLPVRDVIHGSATSVLAKVCKFMGSSQACEISTWRWTQEASLGDADVHWHLRYTVLILFFVVVVDFAFVFMGGCFFSFKQIFSHLFVQCWGWMHGLQRARQPSHHWTTSPIHSVSFIPDGCTRSLSNLNFPFFSHGLVLPARSIFCCSKSI